MLPLQITLENANEIVPDARRKLLENEARKWANSGLPARTRWKTGQTYWHSVVKEHERIVWLSAYRRRVDRIKRMAS